jgi:hypothetical protein
VAARMTAQQAQLAQTLHEGMRGGGQHESLRTATLVAASVRAAPAAACPAGYCCLPRAKSDGSPAGTTAALSLRCMSTLTNMAYELLRCAANLV